MNDQERNIMNYILGIAHMRERNMKKPKKFKFNGTEDLLLHYASFHTPQERPRKYRKGKLGECFSNATELALENEELIYCEGIALVEGLIPTLHGWCITKDKKVIDPTWNDGVAYFGIAFNRESVLKQILKQEAYGFIDNWQAGWPLMTEFQPTWLAEAEGIEEVEA